MEYSIKTVERLPNQLRHDKLAAARALTSLTSVLLFVLASPATAQIKEWDPGLPKDLFKSGPPGRLRDARCKACEDAMAKLQAAMDDWYAMELSDGERLKKAGTTNPDFKEGSEQQKNGKAEIEDAIAGLGQPGDKGKAAQKKQQENSARDAKENANKGKNAKEILKAKIAKLRDELTNCEKTKCKEEEAPSTPTPTPQVVVPGGAPGQPKPPPPPNITIPPPPADACFKDQAEKDAYLDKLDAQRKPIFDKWFVDRKEANEDGATQGAKDKFAQSDANLRAIDAAIQAAGAMGLCSTPTPKPSGGGKATGPGKGKPKAPPKVRTGGNVSLPEGNFYALISENKIKVETSGTGETIGHIADLKIENVTDDSINCVIPPMVLESRSRKNQDYACPQTENITIDPHQTEVVPIDGVCVNRHKPPVGKHVSGDLVVNTGDPTIPQNPDSHMRANQARDLLRICTSKYDAADKLQKDGALKDLPYKDKQKQKDIVVQWSTWSDPRISEITGAPPATREDLKKVVYQQLQTDKPMSPETRKKADQGIDAIFEKVELTTAKAKDLEKPSAFFEGPVSTEKPGAFFKPGTEAKPATVAQPGDIAHVEDKPIGGKGHWAVKVKLPSGEIVEVWFESDEPPPLEFCNNIKINKTHTSSPGHNTVVDEYVKNPSPTPTATATPTPTATATPRYKTYLWTPPPPATPTATPKYKIYLWTPPPTAAQPPQSPVPTEPEKPKEEGGKATEPEPWAPPDLPHWLEPWWEAVKAGTGIVPGKLPGGKDALGAIIARLNVKIREEMANGHDKEAEFYENLKKRLQDIYNSMEDKD